MDTVQEENRERDFRKVGFVSCSNDRSSEDEWSDDDARTRPASPWLMVHHHHHRTDDKEKCLPVLLKSGGGGNTTPCRRDSESQRGSFSSRRASVIIQALRRPSQAIALSTAHAVMNQRRYLLTLMNGQSIPGREELEEKKPGRRIDSKLGDDALTIILSALYAKMLVVLGMALPITQVISQDVQVFYYQGFYLYLYLGSMAFVSYMYVTVMRAKALQEIIKIYQHEEEEKREFVKKKRGNAVHRYGSFYLRLGAIAFGIGSMVHSGLEFARYFELIRNPHCDSASLEAVVPAIRMLLVLLQIQFVFLNTKTIDFNGHKIISRFGLMHMIATNLCEWLYVLVAETKHEIVHLAERQNATNNTTTTTTTTNRQKFCQEDNVFGSLVANASPFLFPCTIEYSLICAVILFEMWKRIKDRSDEKHETRNNAKHEHDHDHDHDHSSNPHNFFGDAPDTNHHLTVDCSNAHRGLFAGIIVVVLTIVSLVVFFVLENFDGRTESRQLLAEFEVNVVELFLYVISTVAVVQAMLRMRNLKYVRKFGQATGYQGIGLDNCLLVVAQSGMFIYCTFCFIGFSFTLEHPNSALGLATEILSFVQTCLQTMFVLDGWWRKCRNIDQAKRKPGRQLVTFLIVANMAMWAINTLEKNRAQFRPSHLNFFGDWAWTIITHVSMPLAIFYRFHSTICLFEIWKSAYKIKSHFKNLKNPLFPVL